MRRQIKRTFASGVAVKEVDVLGTTELSNTNAAYVGALDEDTGISWINIHSR